MPLYENVFIARQDISGAQVDALADTFTQLIAEQGGEIKKREYWGLRNLAYRMNKNRKGHYILFNIDAPAPAIAELERTMRINEDVVRYLTLRVDALEEGPSSAMQSRGSREDRPRRSDRDRYGEGRERFGEPRESGERPGERPAGERPSGEPPASVEGPTREAPASVEGPTREAPGPDGAPAEKVEA
jgi:small subunit ribosomal protein S6